MKNEVGILLEGGAMRSIYSAGVLDFLLEKKIEIPNVLAVSAGAYVGMNYASGQKGRIMQAMVEPLEDYKYLGFGTFLKTGAFFDMDYLFDEIPKEKSPFDFQKFLSFGRFITSTVDCLSGELIYHERFDTQEQLFQIVRAANSLPIVAKATSVEGRLMVDGGIVDAIPIERALEEGWKKIVVVLTREDSYRKKEGRTPYIRAVRAVYRKYKKMLKLVDERAKKYNDALEKIAQLEKEGRAFVLRPVGICLDNQEGNIENLKEYYRHGYEAISKRYEELLEFLGK